jgi:hypothetical protein
MNDDFEAMFMQLWTILKYYSSLLLDQLQLINKNLSHNSWASWPTFKPRSSQIQHRSVRSDAYIF